MTDDLSDKDARDAFFDQVYELACNDEDLVFITADADAFSLRKFKKDFPERFINVGVAEQTMVLLASGLAMCGKNVFIYSIIPFITQRALEHIKVNICSMNLPVTIVGCGAGLSFGFDGPTHHATQDISAMKSIPGIKILSPSDARSSMLSANDAYNSKQPTYVRLDKGKFSEIYSENDNVSDGFIVASPVQKYNIITTGFMTDRALSVVKKLSESGVDVGVIDIYRIKPMNITEISNLLSGTDGLFIIEEHSIVGGLCSSVSDMIVDSQINKSLSVTKIALPDKQIFEYGDRDWLHSLYGIDAKTITDTILSEINNEGV